MKSVEVRKQQIVSLNIILMTTVIIGMVLMGCASTPKIGEARMANGTKQENRYPVVFVHGFMGFDHLEFPSFSYWGGVHDFVGNFNSLGIEAYSAKIGPVSSVYDRACELYAFIKGGRVDYGLAHSLQYGHDRYGVVYPGVFPEWGDISPDTGERRKIHLVSHSMGGQTVRMLASLLECGNTLEQSAQHPEGSGISSLFSGGKEEWISSIVTISTPHNGTSLTERFKEPDGLIKFFASSLASHSSQSAEPVIDLQLGHWEGAARDGEGLSDFLDRAIEEDLWLEQRDFAFYDLSIEGAAELNSITPAVDSIYYFSLATSRTHFSERKQVWLPEGGMLLPLHGSAKDIGSRNLQIKGIEGDWRENDGVVNTVSMAGPQLGSSDIIVPWSIARKELPKKGVWNYLGKVPLDHWQIHVDLLLGGDQPEGFPSLFAFYYDLVLYLLGLPG